ncbi:alpha/beta fold hydrolase [Streptomyces sp. NBC_00691]|uniref:alpha/beta fold hydrolase n=1 Tax=Streptomyces sp. NBC_00691 TaxID=2903671 RepID=UPI002E366828|nr:alpha/beta fold hydrolase [Streptomyces sp. NBC_00691]
MSEETVRLSHEGFSYSCRVNRRPHGTRPPVFLFGGALHRNHGWARRLERALPSQTAVVTVDLPGFGAADSLPPTHDATFLAGAAWRAVERLGFQQYDLVGQCLGGFVVHQMLRQARPGVNRVVLSGVCAGPWPGPQLRAELRNAEVASDSGDRATLLHVATRLFFGSAASAAGERGDQSVLPQFRDRIGSLDPGVLEDLRSHLYRAWFPQQRAASPTPDVPVLVFTGVNDVLTPPREAHQLASSFPRGRFAVVEDAGHMIHIERPDEYGLIVASHLSHRPGAVPHCRPLSASERQAQLT